MAYVYYLIDPGDLKPETGMIQDNRGSESRPPVQASGYINKFGLVSEPVVSLTAYIIAHSLTAQTCLIPKSVTAPHLSKFE